MRLWQWAPTSTRNSECILILALFALPRLRRHKRDVLEGYMWWKDTTLQLRSCSILRFIRFRIQLTSPYIFLPFFTSFYILNRSLTSSYISLHPLIAPYISLHLLTSLIFMFIYLIIFYRQMYDFLKIEFFIWFVTCIGICIISYTNV